MAYDKLVRLYVPGTVEVNVPAPKELRDNVLGHVAYTMSVMFGGATATEATGYWLSDGEIVKEPVTVVASYTDGKTLNARRNDLFKLAGWVGSAMTQQSVALELDGTMSFIPYWASQADGAA